MKHVIFPLRIVPKNPNEPVQLRAAISYAVCEKLCLPVEAEAELAFTSSASALDSVVAAALNKVPKPVGTAEATPIALKSLQARRRPRHRRRRRAESRPGSSFMPKARRRTGRCRCRNASRPDDKDIARFEFKLDGLPPNTRPEGALLKLTVVGADGAFEYNVRLN